MIPRSEKKPKQSLGQNFLVDANVANNIVDAFNLSNTDTALEIGPGPGVLTQRILTRIKKLIAVEIDGPLAESLNLRFGDLSSFVLHHCDFLKFDMGLVPESDIRVIGNIPYNITSPIFFKVLEARNKVRDLTMLIQKEVAIRIVSKPNTKEYGIMAVMSQAYADVEILMHVPKTVFRPRPKIDSSLVRWTFHDKFAKDIENPVLFNALVRQAFGQRRKMMRNTLKEYYEQDPELWDFTKRPEQLSVIDWIELSNRIHSMQTPP